jgi:tryptophanyl-tRNA synthetase
VGQDQLPHLELTREIARRFNSLYKEQIFPEPESLLTAESKLPGTDRRKMSKSYNNFIALSDAPQEVRKKVMTMITDPKKIKKSDAGHPKQCNVFNYHCIFTKGLRAEGWVEEGIYKNCRSGRLGCVECKNYLADSLVERLKPIQAKRRQCPEAKVREILSSGAQRAKKVAARTLSEAKKTIGLN